MCFILFFCILYAHYWKKKLIIVGLHDTCAFYSYHFFPVFRNHKVFSFQFSHHFLFSIGFIFMIQNRLLVFVWVASIMVEWWLQCHLIMFLSLCLHFILNDFDFCFVLVFSLQIVTHHGLTNIGCWIYCS